MRHATTMRGGALILVILLMMALAMFGVLSMVSADSDYKMAVKSAEWVRVYYALEDSGQHKLHQAGIMTRESGFETLATAGWELDGSVARINLRADVQNLAITVELRPDGSLDVTEWRQWQDSFEYEEGDGGDLWL